MSVVYPTTPVQDGMPKPHVPICVQTTTNAIYCFDMYGNIIYTGNNILNKNYGELSSDPNIYANSVQTNKIISAQNGFLALNAQSTMIGYIVAGTSVPGRPFFGIIYSSGSLSVPVGTSNTYGSNVTLYSNYVTSGWYAIALPIYITVTWGGTFASGETVTVKLTFNITPVGSSSVSYSPSTTLSATTTGSQSLNINDIIAIIAPAITSSGNYTVSSITAAAASSASSTSVTVTVQAWVLTS